MLQDYLSTEPQRRVGAENIRYSSPRPPVSAVPYLYSEHYNPQSTAILTAGCILNTGLQERPRPQKAGLLWKLKEIRGSMS